MASPAPRGRNARGMARVGLSSTWRTAPNGGRTDHDPQTASRVGSWARPLHTAIATRLGAKIYSWDSRAALATALHEDNNGLASAFPRGAELRFHAPEHLISVQGDSAAAPDGARGTTRRSISSDPY